MRALAALQQAEHDAGRHRLARAGFADQRDALAFADVSEMPWSTSTVPA